MNENELLIEIQKHNETLGQLAYYLGIETQTLERKMSDDTDCDFTMGEIKKIKEHYNFTSERVDEIFFNLELS